MTTSMTSRANQPGARSLAVSIAAPFIASAIGSAATRRSVGTWYQSLEKPEWNPPRWVFGPVWTVLYLAMGVASWLVWRDRATAREVEERTAPGDDGSQDEASRRHALALGVYGVQLALNALWSVLFFGTRRPRLAFFEIVGLWSAILATVVSFARVRTAAGALLVPYLAWSTYAAALNGAIWRLNRSRLAAEREQ